MTRLTHLTALMQPVFLFLFLPLLTHSTLACLELEGFITGPDGFFGPTALAIDNGRVVCHSVWDTRLDQDYHWSLGCLPGYVYAMTRNGQTAWYSNGYMSWRIDQNPTPLTYGPYWHLRLFGC